MFNVCCNDCFNSYSECGYSSSLQTSVFAKSLQILPYCMINALNCQIKVNKLANVLSTVTMPYSALLNLLLDKINILNKKKVYEGRKQKSHEKIAEKQININSYTTVFIHLLENSWTLFLATGQMQ